MAEAAKTRGKRADRPERKGVRERLNVASVRRIAATTIWVVAVLAALVLAVGVLVIALDFNRENAIVDFFVQTADRINILGELKSFDAGKTESSAQDALVKTVLVNWGICAVVYLVVGKVLDRLIRP